MFFFSECIIDKKLSQRMNLYFKDNDDGKITLITIWGERAIDFDEYEIARGDQVCIDNFVLRRKQIYDCVVTKDFTITLLQNMFTKKYIIILLKKLTFFNKLCMYFFCMKEKLKK